MASAFAQNCIMQLNFALGMYEKFLAICPDAIWQENFGGRPVSQQFYHALGATAFYLESITGEQLANKFPHILDPFPENVDIYQSDLPQPAKNDAGELLSAIWKSVDKMATTLADAVLTRRDEPVSKFIGVNLDNAAVLAIISGHLLYHLGSCDSALRGSGLAGAFSGIGSVKSMLAKRQVK